MISVAEALWTLGRNDDRLLLERLMLRTAWREAALTDDASEALAWIVVDGDGRDEEEGLASEAARRVGVSWALVMERARLLEEKIQEPGHG